jgi:hypothetical protein
MSESSAPMHRSIHVRLSEPTIGPYLPSAAVHLSFLALATTLCLMSLPSLWLGVGLLLAVLGTFLPHRVSPWWLLLLLGLSQLGREPSMTDWRFFVLLAGIHLLHLLASAATMMPWRARTQVAALVRMVRGFAILQVPVQSIAVGILLLRPGGGGTIAGLSVVAAVSVSTVAAILALRARHERA